MGESVIDFLPIIVGEATTGFTMHIGGSPLNVALGVARLGQPAAYAGLVSSDFFGRQVRAFCEREGIDTTMLVSVAAPSTLSFVAVERGEPAYTFYGENAADTLLTAETLPPALLTDAAALHIGSIALLRGTTPDAALAACEQLRSHALLSLDPNIRASVVRPEQEHAYRSRLAKLYGIVDLVKLSTVDLAWLLPGGAPADYAAHILGHGAALAVVTLGEDGIIAWRAGDRAPIQVPGVPVTVADTIGAGDTVDAALLAGLAERAALTRARIMALSRDDLAALLHFAASAAAITVSRAGANPPTRAEVTAARG